MDNEKLEKLYTKYLMVAGAMREAITQIMISECAEMSVDYEELVELVYKKDEGVSKGE